jgi:hypothetical protein
MRCENCKIVMNMGWEHCSNCNHKHINPPISDEEVLELDNTESESWIAMIEDIDK